VQALEGDIDSSHIDYVHAKLRPDGKQRGTFRPGQSSRARAAADGLTAPCYSAPRLSGLGPSKRASTGTGVLPSLVPPCSR